MRTAFLLFLSGALFTRAWIYWYRIKRRPVERQLQRLRDEQQQNFLWQFGVIGKPYLLCYSTERSEYPDHSMPGRQIPDLTSGDCWLGWESAFAPEPWHDVVGIHRRNDERER